jgi:signal transduction histidine kinase
MALVQSNFHTNFTFFGYVTEKLLMKKMKVSNEKGFSLKLADYDHKIFNLTENGCFLESSILPKINSETKFELKVEGHDSLTGNSKVIGHVEKSNGPFLPKGFEVEFITFDDNTRGQYDRLFSEQILHIKSKDVMTPNVLSLRPETKIRDILVALNKANTGSVLITSDTQELLGIFTERDVLKHCAEEGFLDSPVSRYMTSKLTTVTVEDSIDVVYDRFRNAHFRHLPVVLHGQATGIISIRDMIHVWSKLLERQKRQLTYEYEKAKSVIVHDLRSPIFAIKGMNELLMLGHDSVEAFMDAKFPHMIDQSCNTMVQLIDDLLEISGINSGRIDLSLTPTNMVDMVARVTNFFRPSAEAKSIEIDWTAGDNIPEFNVDKRRFEQILQNLLSNAIKYSPEGANVKTTMKFTGPALIIEVEDSGQGIPEEELPKIFKELAKISTQPTNNEPSTGLGLSIVKKLVEVHGGQISVSSTVGKGTTFKVELPAQILAVAA